MRVNVYEEEITDEMEIVWVEPRPGVRYCGVRIFLHSSDRLHNKPTDDDRSAVTFWLGTPAQAYTFFRHIADKLEGELL